MELQSSLEAAKRLDGSDALARFRSRFFMNEGQVYLDGNSLGLLSRDAERSLLAVVEKWKTRGIAGWLDDDVPWFTMAETLAARVAKLVGAEPEEVAIANSMTVNLHQLLATLYQPHDTRTKVLIDAHSFPTDRYALRSHLRLRALDPDEHLVIVKPGESRFRFTNTRVREFAPIKKPVAAHNRTGGRAINKYAAVVLPRAYRRRARRRRESS